MKIPHNAKKKIYSFTIEPATEVKVLEENIIKTLIGNGTLLVRNGDNFQEIYLTDGVIDLAREIVLDRYRVYLEGFNMAEANIEPAWNGWPMSASDPLILECSFRSKKDMDRFKRAVAL